MKEGEIFKNIRKALDMDQVSFGTMFGKGASWTTKLENGYNECFRQFLQIASILIENYNVSAHYILTGNGPIFQSQKHSNTDANLKDHGYSNMDTGGWHISEVEFLSGTRTGAFMLNAANLFREKFGINDKTRDGLNILLVDTATAEIVSLHKELDRLSGELQQATLGKPAASSEFILKLENQKVDVQAKIAKVKEELMILLTGGTLDI